MTTDNVTRRGFAGALGTMAAMGAGAGMLQEFMGARAAHAEEAAQDAAADGTAADEENPVTGDGCTTPLRAGIPGVKGSANPAYQGPAEPICTREEAIEWIANQPMVVEDYTTPSGKVIPAAYINLRNRLNRRGLAVGSITEDDVAENDAYWDWMMWNYNEREAWWLSLMPFPQLFTATDFADKTGFPEYECREMCETLAMKGLLMRFDRGGVPWYFVSNMPFGHIEKFDDPEYLHGWTSLFSGLGLLDNVDAGTKLYSPAPVSVDVVANSEVVTPYDDWKAIIARNDTFVIDPCCCKSMAAAQLGDYRYLDDRDARLEDGHNDRINVCLAMGELAEYYIWKGVGRQVSREEAMDSVQQSVDEGMIIEHYYDANTEVICQCRADHCGVLGPQKALAGQGDAVFCQSNYTLELDKDACVQCGACIERCPMFAISFGDDGYPQMGPECAICGQCAYICPANARVLKPKPIEQQIVFEPDTIRDNQEKAIYRRMKGHLFDFLPSDPVPYTEVLDRAMHTYANGSIGENEAAERTEPLMWQTAAAAGSASQMQTPASGPNA